MTYQNIWWYPNFVEYAAGVKDQKTWPSVPEQYRRPGAEHGELRQYDLPTEQYEAALYNRLPRLGLPTYRGNFRNHPHTVTSYHPGPWPEGRPRGFHGRRYYEDGPPQFKYDGPRRDKLYWLEREPYLPTFPRAENTAGRESANSSCSLTRGLNVPQPQGSGGSVQFARHSLEDATRTGSSCQLGASRSGGRASQGTLAAKRITQDGPGFL